jgi:hypothetical protein
MGIYLDLMPRHVEHSYKGRKNIGTGSNGRGGENGHVWWYRANGRERNAMGRTRTITVE